MISKNCLNSRQKIGVKRRAWEGKIARCLPMQNIICPVQIEFGVCTGCEEPGILFHLKPVNDSEKGSQSQRDYQQFMSGKELHEVFV